MSYCTSSDIVAEIQNTSFSTDTRPTLAQVDQFCLDISGKIDAILNANAVLVPVTDSTGLPFLKQLAIEGVCEKVYFVMGNQADKRDAYGAKFEKDFDRLIKNPNIVSTPNHPTLNSSRDNFSTAERDFSLNKKQW